MFKEFQQCVSVMDVLEATTSVEPRHICSFLLEKQTNKKTLIHFPSRSIVPHFAHLSATSITMQICLIMTHNNVASSSSHLHLCPFYSPGNRFTRFPLLYHSSFSLLSRYFFPSMPCLCTFPLHLSTYDSCADDNRWWSSGVSGSYSIR